MRLSNFYLACLWSLLCFAAMVPFAQLCFHWIEAPFLRLRRPYVRQHAPRPIHAPVDGQAGAASEAIRI